MAEIEERREGVAGEVQGDSADSSLYMNKTRMSPWCPLPFAVGLAVRAARLLGLAPLALQRQNGTLRAAPSTAWACLGYAIAVLYDTYVIMALKDAVTSGRNYKPGDLLKILNATIHVLIVNVALFGAHGRSRFTVASLHLVDKIRRYMHEGRNGVARSQWKIWKIYTLMYLMTSILYFCFKMFQFQVGSQEMDVSNYILFGIISLIFVPILEIQLLWVAMTVNNIFVDVNRKLEVVVCKIENDPSSVSAEDVNVIPRVAVAWTAGRDLAHRMGLQHGALLAVFMCHRVFHLMFTSYSIIFALLYTEGLVHYEDYAYCVLCLVGIVLMIHPGHVIEEEMEVMCELAVRGEEAAEAGLARAQLRTLCRQLEAARAVGLVVAPLGLFVLDRPLLVKILGGIITYLVILLQIN